MYSMINGFGKSINYMGIMFFTTYAFLFGVVTGLIIAPQYVYYMYIIIYYE